MAPDLTRAVLLFRDGDEQDFPIPDAPEVRLGLAASNDVRLPFEGVSRSHAKILRDEKGYWIEDAGSSNGTFLNGQRVVRRRRLEHLDVLRFGRWHRLIFVRKTTPEAPGSRRGILSAWLESLDAEHGHRRDIPRGAVTLGRSPAANVQADSHLVSKLHARLERTGEQLSVADLHSANGTFVNGKRVESQILADGDELSLAGSVRFRVHIEEGDRPSRESKAVPLSNRDSKFPFPSDWKTRIEWSPEDLAALQKAYREEAAETELSPRKETVAAKTAGPAVAPPASKAESQRKASGQPEPQPVAAPPTPAPSATAPVAETPPPSPPLAPAAAALPATHLEIEGIRLEGKTRQVTLGLGDHIVGRSPESALQLEGGSISRRHALIRVRADGVTATDLGSANGTYVNARRVAAETPLAPGDEVRFGEVSFRVHLSEKSAGDAPDRK